MAPNYFSFGWQFDYSCDTYGPRDLAEGIIEYRRARQRESHPIEPPLSEAATIRLIEMAYAASLRTDEGRYPRARIVASRDYQDGLHIAVTLDSTIASANCLRKLLPAVSETNNLLAISEQADGSLRCVGVSTSELFAFEDTIGYPVRLSGLSGNYCYIRVDGPGRIRVSDNLTTLSLDGGRIRPVFPFSMLFEFRENFKQAIEPRLALLESEVGSDSLQFFGGALNVLSQSLDAMVATMLFAAIERRHGGAFVILPIASDVPPDQIKCRHVSRASILDSVVDVWKASISYVQSKDTQSRDNATHHWRWKYEFAFEKAKAIGALSAIDGCVVLNQNFELIGFGGVIGITDTELEERGLPFVNIKTREPIADDERRQFGTRHQSAIRLCRLFPGAIAFVISQDGELRLIYSDRCGTYCLENIHVLNRISEQV